MDGPIAPAWFVLPLAAVTMLVTAGYLIALREAPAGVMPERRRRLRTLSAWIVMVAVPLTAYGFGIATTDDPRTFVLVWTIASGLLVILLVVGLVDLADLWFARRRARRVQRRELMRRRNELLTLALSRREPGRPAGRVPSIPEHDDDG